MDLAIRRMLNVIGLPLVNGWTRLWLSMRSGRRVADLSIEVPCEIQGPQRSMWDAAVDLIDVGDAHREAGEPDRAREAYQSARAAIEGIAEGCDEASCEAPALQMYLSNTLRRLGEVGALLGDAEEAVACYSAMVDIDQKVLERVTSLTDSLRLTQLGDRLKSRKRLERARDACSWAKAVAERVVARAGESTRSLGVLSLSLGKLADVERARGDLAASHSLHERRLEVDRQVLLIDRGTPDALLDVAFSLAKLAFLEVERNDFIAAKPRIQEALMLVRKVVSIAGETYRALEVMAYSVGVMGELQRRSGDFSGAYRSIQERQEIERKSGRNTETIHPLNLWLLAADIGKLADEEFAHGQFASSASHTADQVAIMLRINAQLFTWPNNAADVSRRLVDLAHANALPVEKALAHRMELWKRLYEHVDLADEEVLARAQRDVARFHGCWLRLALQSAPEHVPEVLAAMQGRKIAALVLEELEQQQPPSGPSSEVWQRFWRLRIELRRLALDLRVISSDSIHLGHDPCGRDTGAMVVGDAIWRQRDAQYRARLADYQACLSELAKQPGFQALQPPQMDTAELRPTLAEGQALLIVVQPPADGEARATPQALLLRRDGYKLVPLPALHGAVARFRRLADAPQQLAGKRYAASRADSASTSPAAHEASDLSSQVAFWSPLRPHLQGLHTLQVVTHGELHMLPLGHEGPGGIQVHHYPGLVFYWLQQKAGQPPAADAGLALQVHSPTQGEELPPIPFVHAEAKLAQSLWSRVRMPLLLDEDIAAQVLHLAGHGEAGPGQEAALLMGPRQKLGLHELLRSRIRPEVVYLSACLVGRTSEDLDGDPLGMVSAFFLRGARSVVAPLVPISDLYAPILAALFHWELRRQRDDTGLLDATRALKWGKEKLEQGDWPEEFAQRVRETYVTPFGELLSSVIASEGNGDGGHFSKLHDVLMRSVNDWVPMCTLRDSFDLRKGVINVLSEGGLEAAARWGGERLAAMLVDARADLWRHPGVQDLLRYMQVYGAPRL